MNAERMAAIRSLLTQELAPADLDITDDSHLHAGHAGARDGRGHFTVRIVSERFDGLRPLERHQLIYGALGDMMRTDIHALRIDARTPAETLSTERERK